MTATWTSTRATNPREAPSGVEFPSQLFRNNGDGTFTDVAQQSGVRNLRYCKASGWGDYDNDGDPRPVHFQLPGGEPLIP